jgi:hypothetical protein
VPRYRRQIAPGSVQHIISRFIDHEFRFDVPDARHEYLRRAPGLLERTQWRAFAFALMSSHVHWAVAASSEPSSAWVKPLHAGFAQWLNASQRRLGPVFADRHRSLSFEGQSFAVLIAYIHNNPVRAGVVSDPAQSDWTSHRAYIGLEPAPSWLDVEHGLWLCGLSTSAADRREFHRFVVARSCDPRCVALSGGDLQQRRTRARAALAAPVELASPVVTRGPDSLEFKTPAVIRPGCHPSLNWQGMQDSVLEWVAESTGVACVEMRSRARVRRVVRARRLAMLVWARYLNRPAVEMAAALCIADSSAAKLIASATSEYHHAASELARRLLSDREHAMPAPPSSAPDGAATSENASIGP